MPVPTNVTVDPDTVQMAVVPELNATGFPDAPPVAVTVYVGPPTVALVGAVDVNVIVWLAGSTVSFTVLLDVAA